MSVSHGRTCLVNGKNRRPNYSKLISTAEFFKYSGSCCFCNCHWSIAPEIGKEE